MIYYKQPLVLYKDEYFSPCEKKKIIFFFSTTINENFFKRA